MDLEFSNLTIVWKESHFLYGGILIFIIASLVFIGTGFICYQRKYFFSFSGALFSCMLSIYVGWIGTGCNSNLNLTLNTFRKDAVISDYLSKTQYRIKPSDFSGFYQKKYKTYFHLLLLLKNGASFKLIETEKLKEAETTLEKLQREFNLPVFFKFKDFPLKENLESHSINSLCNYSSEKILLERIDNSCRLSWKLNLPGYFYLIFSCCLIVFLIWLDSVIKNGFSKSHALGFFFISIFLLSFGYLIMQRWNSTVVLRIEENKVSVHIKSMFFGKHRESFIQANEIKTFESEISTMQDAITVSSKYLDNLENINDIYSVAISPNYMIIPVYGLPVVDKLLICDIISKMR